MEMEVMMKKKSKQVDEISLRREALIRYLEVADAAAVLRLYEALEDFLTEETEDEAYGKVEEGGAVSKEEFLADLDQAEREAVNDKGISWEETVREIKQQFQEKHKKR